MQARSTSLVADILEAAVRVLREEGAARFTTVRVAQLAGVSVGSLYQYFPNKQALLFRLQADEWQQTWATLEAMLNDTRRAPLARFRALVVAFFLSEHDEAPLRIALDDAGALIRDAPEARAHARKVERRFAAFLEEVCPALPQTERAFAADFVLTSMAAIAEKVTAQHRTRAEVLKLAETSADLLCGYLKGAGRVRTARSRSRTGASARGSRRVRAQADR